MRVFYISHLAVQPCPVLTENASAFSELTEWKHLFALNEISLDCYFYVENPILAFSLT